ncbi:26S proteasome non-ATPase regulatory subunit 7-like [Sycon ciliatum]|uniref:26S proteasome non-ATPase regulatory subunit 7-like n=1 Tax=Sycon ciliatum TaxID=27933 RepID=UPI0031F68174|eukprot:scpid78196/ scgid24714/ 26S proteasome non-ATPase regulatory subunit 7; 26S proteasome regulatory subunit RPN8; 26S proteasome regulatory subunit S12; Proteasome subunit p39B; Proteasome subunit p40; Protein Mov34
MASSQTIDRVVVHPIVLLSVVDHYHRLGGNKRTVGVLLGAYRGNGILDVSNSFAVPFEEDAKDPSIWFLDHDYLENMYRMFKKVTAKEKIVGWYHTGPKLRVNDIDINQLINKYCYTNNSALVIIEAQPTGVGLPTDAYVAVEEVHDDGSPVNMTFTHVASEMGAEEAEEVGVEHLLRDIKDTSVGNLSHVISSQLLALKGLQKSLDTIRVYLTRVVTSERPVNFAILNNLQDIFNLLPNLSVDDLAKALTVKTNDQMLVLYLGSLVRSVIALHNLLDNKLKVRAVDAQA